MVTDLPEPGVTPGGAANFWRWAKQLNAAITSRYTATLADIGSEATARGNAILAYQRVQPATVALLGESITATTYQGAGVGTYDAPAVPAFAHSQGYWTWANILLGQRMQLSYTGGVAGNTTADILARVTDVTDLPVMPGYCVVQACINDILTDVPVATVTANLTGIYDALQAKGITVVACTALPIWTAVDARRKRQEDINNWIRDYCTKQPGMILCDWAGIWANASDGAPKTGYHNGDGVHPSVAGAAALGKALADCLRPRLPAGPLGLASNNVDGSATVNPMMVGTGGFYGAGCSGSLATSWLGGKLSGAGTLAFGKAARTDGISGEWQSLTLAGGGGSFIMYQDYSAVLPAAGEKWFAELEFSAADLAAVTRFTLQIIATGGANPGAYAPFTGGTFPFPVSTDVSAGAIETPPITIPVGVSNIQTLVQFDGTAGTVRVSRIRARKVEH